MKGKLALLAHSKVRAFPLLVVLVGGLGFVTFSGLSGSTQQESQPPKRGRLQWHAAKAKKEGKQLVEIPTGITDYPGRKNKSIEQALTEYTVVIAEPTATYTNQVNDNNLLTWYKFNILDILTPVRTPPCVGCMTLTPPHEIPINTNEVWIPRGGGTLVIDGVEIRQREPGFPPFEEGQRYLLFLMWYPNKVATTAGGPVGVYKITEADKLAPFHQESDTIQEGIRLKFHGSLSKLRQGIQPK
jgi:hypothetical protein